MGAPSIAEGTPPKISLDEINESGKDSCLRLAILLGALSGEFNTQK
jgi:hypothetical protein